MGDAENLWAGLELATGSPDGCYDAAYVPRELLGLIDWTPRRVLDVGCSHGALGRALAERFPAVSVVGIEPSPAAAAEARRHLAEVFCCTFETLPAQALTPESFDTVVLADVLEHMFNPWSTLQALRPVLTADARILISLPNVRNLWLLNEIAQGRFGYTTAGLLDITHVRFFTYDEAERLLAAAGYKVQKLSLNIDPRLASHLQSLPEAGTSDLELGRVRLLALDRQAYLEALTLQLLLVARLSA